MSAAQQYGFEAAALGALEKMVKEQKQPARDACHAALIALRDEHGTKSIDIMLPDGTVVATAALPAAEDSFQIVDEAAFVAWVAANHPQYLSVHYDFKRQVIDTLIATDDGEVVNKNTGEAVPFAAFVPAANAAPKFRLTYSRKSKTRATSGDQMIIAAWRRGELPDAGLGQLGAGAAE